MLNKFFTALERLPPASAISSLPSAKQAQQWFWIFALSHTLVWTLVMSWLRHNAPLDAIEGLVWGNQWQLGYDKHPPLAAWLTAAVTLILGKRDWVIYFLSQLCVLGSFWAVWRLCKQFFSPLYAFISVMLLDGIFYYNVLATSIDPDSLMLPLWALTCLYVYNAIRSQKNTTWLLAGIFAGLAMLTKYESVLLLATLGLVLFITPEGRKSFSKPGLYLALLAFTVIMLPNVIWLVNHNFLPFKYALGRAQDTHSIFNPILHPLAFIFAQLGMLLAMFFLALPFYFAKKENFIFSEFNKTYLLAIAIGPLAIALLLSVFTGLQLMAGWGYPMFSFAGALLLFYLQPRISLSLLRRFLMLFAFFITTAIIIKAFSVRAMPYLTHTGNNGLYPGKAIAKAITRQWHTAYQRRLIYVAGERRLVAYVTAYSKDKPVPYFNWDTLHNSWIDEASLRKTGAVFVWPAGAEERSILPAEIAARFPDAIPQAVQTFSYTTSATIPPVRVASAYLPPNDLINIRLQW